VLVKKEVKDVEANLDQLLIDVRHEPVRIQKDGVDVAVVLSPTDFDLLVRPTVRPGV
jgi:PHD/YefM family antitoxin component YafN of YafNO toxin-antitoxin module